MQSVKIKGTQNIKHHFSSLLVLKEKPMQQESTGRRDTWPTTWISNLPWPSEAHRTWGALPATDCDLLLIEHEYGEPVAIVDWKRHTLIGKLDMENDYSIISQRRLADRAEIVFIVVFYWPTERAFVVQRGNELAKDFYPRKLNILTEKEFVKSLFHLHNKTCPTYISKNLSTTLPKVLEEKRELQKKMLLAKHFAA